MEIVIENPGESTPSMVYRPCQTTTGTEYFVGDLSNPEYFVNLQNQDMNGQTPVRRVDRSGLLEMPKVEPIAGQRHLTGAELALDAGQSALRRVDRSGLLEPVPEIPDQDAYGKRRSEQGKELRAACPGIQSSFEEKQSIKERHLTGAEGEREEGFSSKAALGSVPQRPGNHSASPFLRKPSTEVHSEVEGANPRILPNSAQSLLAAPGHLPGPINAQFRFHERRGGLSPKSTARLSPQVGNCTENDQIRSRGRFSPMSSVKFAPIDSGTGRKRQSCIEFPESTYFSLDNDSSSRNCHTLGRYSPRMRTESPLTIASRPSSATSLVGSSRSVESDGSTEKSEALGRLSPRIRADRRSPMALSIPDVIEAHGSAVNGSSSSDNAAPDGERAEAEGCEHTAIESLEEARVSFKAPNKLLHNENIQTLRVIILSEQL